MTAYQWLGRDILHPEHIPGIERSAALNEFQHLMPRHVAEAKAHSDYVRESQLDAAAHHLLGVKAAQAVGDMESARKYGLMYQQHCEKLGLNPLMPPDKEITKYMKAEDRGSVSSKFKPHKADYYVLPKESMLKSEVAKEQKKNKGHVCRCKSYSFPHRHGSGKCKGPLELK